MSQWVRITPMDAEPCDTRRCEVPGCNGVFTHQVAFDSPDERVKVTNPFSGKVRQYPERRCVLVCEAHKKIVQFSDERGVAAG